MRCCYDHPEFPSRHFPSALISRRTLKNSCLLASSELSFCGTDLSVWQSSAAPTSEVGACEAAATRTLGYYAGTEFHLRALQPRNQEIRFERHLHMRAGTRRPRNGGELIPRRHIHRVVSKYPADRRRPAPPVQAVFVSRRHSQPRRAGNPRFHP